MGDSAQFANENREEAQESLAFAWIMVIGGISMYPAGNQDAKFVCTFF